jgi:hypothetical protein
MNLYLYPRLYQLKLPPVMMARLVKKRLEVDLSNLQDFILVQTLGDAKFLAV